MKRKKKKKKTKQTTTKQNQDFLCMMCIIYRYQCEYDMYIRTTGKSCSISISIACLSTLNYSSFFFSLLAT